MSQFNNDKAELFEKLLEQFPDHNARALLKEKIAQIKRTKLNILLVGATGAGKSSTINALFERNEAKVGQSPYPETIEITKYEFKNTILWDTPGLGDSPEKDQKYLQMIKEMLQKEQNGEALIDLVLCIIDGASRDLATTYTLIDHILPEINNESSRIIVAINKADLALSGKHWDSENSQPKEKLLEFLEEKVESIRKRIKDSHKIEISPIYYSAGYKEDDEEQMPYNISKLLDLIISKIQNKKRAVILNDINKNATHFMSSDGRANYNKDIQEKAEKGFWDSLKEMAKEALDVIGEFFTSEHGKKIIGTAVNAGLMFFFGKGKK